MDINASIKDYIVPAIAVLAFLLSLYNAYRHWRENRPKPELILSRSEIDESGNKRPGFVCFVRNIGKGPLVVKLAGFQFQKDSSEGKIPQTRYYSYIDQAKFPIKVEPRLLPMKLESGSSIEIFIHDEVIRIALVSKEIFGTVEIRGYIQDGDGKFYFSYPCSSFNE